MLLFGFLVLPVALSMGRHVETQNYALTIDDNTLKDIRIIGKSPDDLNLSNLGLKAIDKSAFAHLSNLKSLNLSNNSLKSIPEFALANLTNLENLDLANNHLVSGKFYVGLSSLKTLNISNNLVNSFEPGHFFGLTKSANIYTQEIEFSTITAAMFENPSTMASCPLMSLEQIFKEWNSAYDDDTVQPVIDNNPSNQNSNVKVCITNGHLKSVEAFKEDEVLPQDCVKLSYHNNILDVSDMGIKTFENGWYRLKDQTVNTLALGYNQITEFTKELLNDLPAGIRVVNLVGNKIEKIKQGVIMRKNPIVRLNLSWNRISEIENGALDNLNLTDLGLYDNRLTNTEFMDSLPSTIRRVSLSYNEISEISAGNFSKFTNFRSLTFRGNNITEIKAQRLRDFSSLKVLTLTEVNLKKIEPGAFQDLKNLVTLDISENQISSLQKGVFAGLDNIEHINLGTNKLKEIPNDVFNAMPNSLRAIALNDNEIESLKTETFVNAPTILLDLSANRISSIESGAFNLPSLKILQLGRNLLQDVKSDLLEGLENLNALLLPFNNITTIKKGFAQKMSKLYDVDLSHNPIRMLENGAFFGLSKAATTIDLNGVPVEIIQGGLFDDV